MMIFQEWPELNNHGVGKSPNGLIRDDINDDDDNDEDYVAIPEWYPIPLFSLYFNRDL
jgi:hypothetical protein